MKVIRKVRSDGKTGPLFYGFNDNKRPIFRYQSQTNYWQTPVEFTGAKEAKLTLTKITKVLGAGTAQLANAV